MLTLRCFYFYDDSYYDSPLLFEVGRLGAMNCLTDLGGKKGIGKRFIKDLNLGKTEMAMGAYFSVMYKYAIGLRLEASFGKVGAYDSILAKVPTTDLPVPVTTATFTFAAISPILVDGRNASALYVHRLELETGTTQVFPLSPRRYRILFF